VCVDAAARSVAANAVVVAMPIRVVPSKIWYPVTATLSAAAAQVSEIERSVWPAIRRSAGALGGS